MKRKLSDYRKNVKTHLVQGLLAAGFLQNSETLFQKVGSDFHTYTVTLADTHYTFRVRERNLRDGWSESRHTYTYMSVQKLLRYPWY